jgi:negative regulator of genetic competence, sporulation and motility
LKRCATKEDLKRFATKEDLDRNATKEDLLAERERTRRHFDIVSERMHEEIRLIAEGQLGTEAKLDRERLQRLVLERRVTVLEDRMGAAPARN